MKVKKVQKIDGYEAEIIVTDGEHDLLGYYYDTNLPPDQIKAGTLVREVSSFLAGNIFRAEAPCWIRKGEGYFSYLLCGKVVKLSRNSIVKVFDFSIELDTQLPGDIREGEFVEFETMRLDVDVR